MWRLVEGHPEMRIGQRLFVCIFAGLLIATGLLSGLHNDSVGNKAAAADLVHMQPFDLPFTGSHEDAGDQHRGTHCHSAAGCLVAMLPGSQQPSATFRSQAAMTSFQPAILAITAPLTRPPIT